MGTGWLALLALAACAGLWARLDGFGARGLAVDETYSLRVAESILQHGLPRLLDGGFYVQGVIPHYWMALSVWLLGPTELALRLPALLAGIALPFLAYRYARGFVSPSGAAALAAAVFVSSWQIEFARFGRMYALFACVALLFLTRVHRSVAGGERTRIYCAHAWAVVAVLCHTEGALLAPLLFVPLLDPERFSGLADRARYGAVTTVVIAGAVAFAGLDFRRLGVQDAYPAEYVPLAAGMLRMPEAVLWAPGLNGKAVAAIVVAVLGAVLLWAVMRLRRGRMEEGSVVTALAAASALTHQLAWTGLFALVLLGRSRGTRLWPRLAWIAAAASVWPAVAVWQGVTSLGALRTLFFGWPDFFESFVRPWATMYPVLGIGLAASIVFLWVRDGKQPWSRWLTRPPGIAAYGLVCLGLVQYFYESVRYQHFLYAVLLTAAAMALGRALGPTRGAIGFLVFFALAGDFDPRHVAHAGGAAVEYRLGRFQSKEATWYPRTDYQGAAAALARLTDAEGAPLVIIGTAEPVTYYYGGEYVRYLDREEYPFWEQSLRQGTVEMWTGRRLMSTADELRAATFESREVLLVRRIPGDARELDPERVWGDRLIAVHHEFRSEDGEVDVIRVELAAQPLAPKQ